MSAAIQGFREAVETRLASHAAADRAAFRYLPDQRLAQFELDEVAWSFVWACVVAAADPLMYPHLVAFGGPDARRGLSPAAFVALTGVAADAALHLTTWLDGNPPMVRLGLLERDDGDYLPSAAPYRASSRLVAHVLEQPRTGSGRLVEPPLLARHDEQQRLAIDGITRALGQSKLVVIEGERGVGRRSAVAIAAEVLARRTLALDAATLGVRDLERQVRNHAGAAILDGAIPLFSDLDRAVVADSERASFAARLNALLDELPGPVVVTVTSEAFALAPARAMERIRYPMPDLATRRVLWADRCGPDVDPTLLRDIAARHKLGAGPIADAAAAAVAMTTGPVSFDHAVAGVRATLSARFGGLAQRLSVEDSWEDMVLSSETHDQLKALLSRVQHAWTVFEEWRFPRNTARGGGVAALFSGPPGTGKTMVAGLIARELQRDLYRIDLSQIVSKWVGETEKQLAQVFDAAEAGNALLLFDEADSLFAKRTEVKSASDRYANLEVNYLLQRIETFGGVTILTTNFDGSIDPALRRRLAAHVVFWPPDQDERASLWRAFLTTRAPVEESIDHARLASDYPHMTGANIRNAALSAAFLAAREGGGLNRDRVHRAARAEYRAMGHTFSGRR